MSDKLERLQALARLLDNDRLSREEFEELKSEVISGGGERTPVPTPPNGGEQLSESEVWFSYQGRIGPGQYWGRFFLAAGLVAFLLLVIGPDVSDDPEVYQGVIGVASLFSIWPATALAWKRLQDQNRNGALFLLVFIPFLGPLIWLVLSVSGGTDGPNRFGPQTGYKYASPSNRPPQREKPPISMGGALNQLNLAADPRTTSRDLDRLSWADESTVRMQVALNPKVDRETLERLAQDSDPDVAEEARQRLASSNT